MSLQIRRNENETWLECALRYAKKYGLEEEVQKEYKDSIKNGTNKRQAAFEACLEWDICEFIND